MGSFGRINEFLALEKCLKPWDWLFTPNEVDEGGKMKVRGLKLRVVGTFLGKLTVAFSCAPTGLIIAVEIQDHGLKIGLWVSWLKVRPHKIFWELICIQNGLSGHIVCGGQLFTLKINFLGPNDI